MGQTAQSLAHPLADASRGGVSADDARRRDSRPSAAHWAFESLPWGYAAAFILGASVVLASCAYLMVETKRAFTTTGPILAAGLVILVYGGLLAGWRRAGVLQQRVHRMQVILKLREYAEHMLESAPSGLVLLSPQRRVLAVNRAFLDGVHLRRDEVVGRRLEELNGARALSSALAGVLQRATVRENLILETATNLSAERGMLRVLLRELNTSDKSREGQILMTVEGLTPGEPKSDISLSPLTP